MQRSSSSTGFLWLAFTAAALTTIGLFFIPAFIIQPFRHQGPVELAWAMAIRQRASLGTLIAALVCLAFALALWTASNRWRKIVVATVMVLVTFSTVMAHLNYFEWMFHPVKSPQFEAESSSKLDKGEMILAVRFGPDARAYPVREMAYHHIVNDVVNGVPIAVTY